MDKKNEPDAMSQVALGDRVVWRSGSHNYTAEKTGIVIFLGPKDWGVKRPPPLKHWLSKEWRDEVRKIRPSYYELCQKFPAKGGGYVVPPKYHTRWTAPSRYKFTRCTSGIVVAVDEYRQLTTDTKQETIKKPKRPNFYAPRTKARKGHTGLVVWREGEPRPEFKPEKVGKWEFVVRHSSGPIVQCGSRLLWWGKGTNEAAAKRHALQRASEGARYSLSSLKIRGTGNPLDENAIEIWGGGK